MNIPDWINSMLSIQRELCKLDTKKVYTYYSPNEGCTKQDIYVTESRLGIKLDKQYTEFLRFANGWRNIYRSVSLLGTNDLLKSEKMDLARDILEIVCPLDEDLEYKVEELLPIAVDEYGADVFVLTPFENGKCSEVIWFAGQEIERFSTFEKFLNAIMQYIVNEVEQYKM